MTQQGPLLAGDRQAQICRLAEQQRTVRVADLAVQFNVTEETIRRDLDQLQGQGLIRRIHGGAIGMRGGTAHEAPLAEREGKNLEAKRAIAARAVKLIQERDTLLLDASTSALQVARLLPPCQLTVVTNSVKVITELAGRDRVTVIALGGIVRPTSLSFVGPVAERTLRNYRVDKAFLSCKGLTLDGIFESNEMEGQLKRLMMECANQVILLADSGKIDQTAFVLIDDLRKVDILITDGQAPPAFTREISEKGIDVVLATEE